MINIKELIEDTSKLNADTLPELKGLLERHPFFQVVRLLYIANLYKLHSPDFGAELRKASVFVPDRTALFTLTEGINYQFPNEVSNADIETEYDSNRTMSLINGFLADRIETDDNDAEEKYVPSVADLTTDYASFLMQQDQQDDKKTKDSPKLKGEELIDSFIEETKGKQRFEMPNIDDEEFSSPEFSEEEEEIYTESMVNIYIKQGRYQQALEILRKISLNNPKKSPNFAAQINLLEIILNGQK
jgi:hypothetical protein